MTHTLILATAIGTMTVFSAAAASEPPTTLTPPSQTVVLSTPNSTSVDIIEVGNRRFQRGYRYGYSYPTYRYNYPPYGYYYRPYGYYYPRYYGAPRSGYYNYGYGQGAVRGGSVRVWW